MIITQGEAKVGGLRQETKQFEYLRLMSNI